MITFVMEPAKKFTANHH